MSCNFIDIEGFSINEIYEQLSHELNLAAQLLPWISYSAQAITILIFCLIYLAWLSITVFLLISTILGAAMLWHLFIEKQLHHEFSNIIVKEREISQILTRISSATKEIKPISIDKENLLKQITDISKQSEILKLTVDKQTISSVMSTRIALFLLLAIFVFVLPVIDPNETDLIFKVVVVTFFIIGPITQLIYALPILLRLDVAFHSMYTFEVQLEAIIKNNDKKL
jgi:putative ATP-binding cassette transporter